MPFCLAIELRLIKISRLIQDAKIKGEDKWTEHFISDYFIFFGEYYLINTNITCNKDQVKLNFVYYSQVKFSESYRHH